MTTTTAPRTSIITADLGHELAAGMAFPMRPALAKVTPASAVALFQARIAFWTAAAAGFQALVDVGCSDAAYDVREALEQAALYAPRA